MPVVHACDPKSGITTKKRQSRVTTSSSRVTTESADRLPQPLIRHAGVDLGRRNLPMAQRPPRNQRYQRRLSGGSQGGAVNRCPGVADVERGTPLCYAAVRSLSTWIRPPPPPP